MNLLRAVAWEEVFLEWYKNEGQNPSWIQLAQERGHSTWADWRIQGYVRRFACERAEWGLYEVTDPSTVVSGWFGGPFRTWIERHYDGERTKSFAELAQRPEIAAHVGIQRRMEDYPAQSIITALMLPDDRIFVIEGMHRACALARMAKEGKPFTGALTFAVGKSSLMELPAVGKNTS